MEPTEGSSTGILVQLDDLGARRVAALLRAVRNQRMQSRQDVARRVGTSVRALRRFEHGDALVPRDIMTRLVDYYGDDLTARFEVHAPVSVDPNSITEEAQVAQLRSASDHNAAVSAAEPSELAVETLLADLALARLGTVLRSTREEQSSSRRDVASQVGTTARDLRRYETGAARVPHGVLTALAEFYGEDLDTHFAHRNPTRVDSSRVVGGVEEAQVHSGDGDEALGAYVGILRRLPDPAPDQPVVLRADDLAILSTALAVEPEHIEGRIGELLARTTRLRRHDRVRRRRRILSGAGIGIVAAALVGFGTGAFVSALPSHADPLTSIVAIPTTVADTSTTVASSSTTAEPSTTLALPSTTLAPPPPVPVPTAVPTAAPPTPSSIDIGVPVTAIEPPTTTTTTFPRPHITTDTTPESIPGTEPVTIITGP